MVELVLRVREALVEAASDALADELGALAVSVEDADADTEHERPIFGEPGLPVPRAAWRHSTVRALFDDESAATEAATLLLAQDWVEGPDVQVQGLQAVADADWVRLTQSQFAPVEITPTFWIVPSWHAAPPTARTVIRLDPGLAFGTGTHPTTRMCLRWIARHARPWPHVLDYGCGSGILAIGAALHGAHEVDAVDIDPAAVTATAANVAANATATGAALPIRAALPDAAPRAAGGYELVLANILARPLTLLAPLLTARLALGGDLVLAGILERQADELRDAYAPQVRLDVADREDGWILMAGRREEVAA